jgi:hypothetical protein
MGKPYSGEDYEPTGIAQTRGGEEEKKSVNEPTTKKFTKGFQAYLDSRFTLEDLMKEEDEKKMLNNITHDAVPQRPSEGSAQGSRETRKSP